MPTPHQQPTALERRFWSRATLSLFAAISLASLTACSASDAPSDDGSTSVQDSDAAADPSQPDESQASEGAVATDGIDAQPVDDWEVVPEQLHFGDDPPPAPDWIESRSAEQMAAAESYGAPHDFSFTDELAASGITFSQVATPDGTKGYKPNHYDHGNGVAVADVDGDGLLDIYFTNQVGSNELYRNLGGGRFENITEAAGVGVDQSISVAGSFADVDNDGDSDLYVTTVRHGNILFQNDGTGAFTDVTEAAGLEYAGHSSSATFFDYDKDGLLDLFVTNVGQYTYPQLIQPAPIDPNDPSLTLDETYTYYAGSRDAFVAHVEALTSEPSILYHNLGDGVFEDVTEATGLVETGWNGEASPFDANGDGWLDLYITDMQGNDEYYENVGGQTFVNKSRELFPKTPWGSMGIKIFDWDNDGMNDIYITDMHSDMAESIGIAHEKDKARTSFPEDMLQAGGLNINGNAFFTQRGPDSYEEISDDIGAENYWPWGLSVGDINADGYDDAFLASSMNFNFRYGVNSLLLNDSGQRWLDSEFVLGVEPRPDGRFFQKWYTLDCGGIDADHGDCGMFGDDEIVTRWEPVGSRASVIFDLDGDGDLDIVTGEFGGPPMVLVSDLAQRSEPSFIEIDLVGSASNRDGLGAKVVVEAGGMSMTKVNDGKSGYLSQSDIPLYFGIGDAAAADSVTVSWPSGAEQVIDGPVLAGERLEIVEP